MKEMSNKAEQTKEIRKLQAWGAVTIFTGILTIAILILSLMANFHFEVILLFVGLYFIIYGAILRLLAKYRANYGAIFAYAAFGILFFIFTIIVPKYSIVFWASLFVGVLMIVISFIAYFENFKRK